MAHPLQANLGQQRCQPKKWGLQVTAGQTKPELSGSKMCMQGKMAWSIDWNQAFEDIIMWWCQAKRWWWAVVKGRMTWGLNNAKSGNGTTSVTIVLHMFSISSRDWWIINFLLSATALIMIWVYEPHMYNRTYWTVGMLVLPIVCPRPAQVKVTPRLDLRCSF